LLAAAASTIETVASTLIPVGFEELARGAELVVLGRVAAQEARFNREGTLILTHTTIESSRASRRAPSTIEISEYGGRVGDRIMLSTGQVMYQEGERGSALPLRDALELWRTCGAHQGRMRVAAGADGSWSASGWMRGKRWSERGRAAVADRRRPRGRTMRGATRILVAVALALLIPGATLSYTRPRWLVGLDLVQPRWPVDVIIPVVVNTDPPNGSCPAASRFKPSETRSSCGRPTPGSLRSLHGSFPVDAGFDGTNLVTFRTRRPTRA